MKKILTIIAGLFIIASIAFVASSTELFKGQAMGGGGGDHDLGGLGGDNKGGFDLTGMGDAASTATATSGAGTASAGAATTNSDEDDEPAISGTYSGPTGGGGGGPTADDDDDDDDDDDGKNTGTVAGTATMSEAATFETAATASSYGYSAASSNSGVKVKDKGNGSGTVIGSNGSSAAALTGGVTSAGASAEITATISDYYVYLIVKDQDGNYVTGIDESDFNLSGGSNTDFSESTSYYTFRFEEEPSVKFSLDLEAYESASTGTISPEEGQQAVSEDITLTAIEYEAQCSDLSMSPDTHEIAADASSVDDIEITISLSGDVVEVSMWPTFLMSFAANDEWGGTVSIETSGSGTFSYSGDWSSSETSSGIDITIEGSDDNTLSLTYSGGAIGDIITASTESSCSDSFTITQAEAEEDDGSEDSGEDDSDDDSDDNEEDDSDDDTEKDDTTTDDIDYDSITQKECEHDFEDVMDEEHEEVICRLAKSGVIDGYDDDHFGYDDYISVAEYTKVLMLLAGYNQSSSDSEILLENNHWGEGWIAKAEELDTLRIRDGFSRNLDLPITRADAALYAVRLAEVEYYPDSSPFSDVDPEDYFGYAVIFLAGTLVDVPDEGVQYALDAKNGDEFEPYDYISRGEAMNMLMNFYLALFDS